MYHQQRQRRDPGVTPWSSRVEAFATLAVLAAVIATILVFLLVFHDVPFRTGFPT